MIRRTQYIPFIAILVSIISSVWAFNTHLVDLDGTLYLQTAEYYLAHGFGASFSRMNWPFFSIFIAEIHRWTSLNLMTAGALLNTMLFALLTAAFLAVSRTLVCRIAPTHERFIMILSALLVLCHPHLAHFRHEWARDPGYWAFVFCALHQALHFLFHKKSMSFAGTFFFLVCALFFRVEGIALIGFTFIFFAWIAFQTHRRSEGYPPLRLEPFFSFFHSGTQVTPNTCSDSAFLMKKIRKTALRLSQGDDLYRRLLPVTSLILGLFFIGLYSTHGRLDEIIHQAQTFTHTLTETFYEKSQVVNQSILNPLARDLGVAPLFLIGGLLTMYLFFVGKAIGWVFLALWIGALWKRTTGFEHLHVRDDRALQQAIGLICGWILIQSLLGLLFAFSQFIFISRWFMLCALLLHLWTPWIGFGIFNQLPTHKRNWFWGLVTVFSLISWGAGHLSFGPSKQYLADAAHWLNTQHPPAIWTPDRQLAFYLHFPDSRMLIDEFEGFDRQNPKGALCQYLTPYHHTDQPPFCVGKLSVSAAQKQAPGVWLAIKISRKDPTFKVQLEQTFGAPDQIFQNRHGDQLSIWQNPLRNKLVQ